MVVLSKLAAGMAFSSTLMGATLAHPGEKHDHAKIKREIAFRNVVAASNRRALEGCTGSAADIALKQRAVARRDAKLKALRQKRGLPVDKPLGRRDQDSLESWVAVDHESDQSYTIDTDPSTIFSQNATCVLVPEVTIGPYWVSGELVREDITDGQTGVPIHVDVQFVDVSTCTGVSDLLIDMWHCNATGVYSGVTATGQGGLDTTFGRGVQETDSDGVVQFSTIYPGHYTGRTNHIHVKSTSGATLLSNGTYVDGTTNHIGQFFFDQDLTTEVEATSPYSTNTQELTTVDEDSIAAGEATEEYDPFLSYVRLGDDISDGLLMFITVGIDTSADYDDQVSAAAHLYEDGGVDTSTGGQGGGPDGGAGGNGTFPSGAPPSGTAIPTDAPTGAAGDIGTSSTTATTTLSTAVPVSGGGRSCNIPGRRRKH